MSELTDRIANVLRAYRYSPLMSCCRSEDEHDAHVAERVADALQLTEEVAYRHRCHEPGHTAADCDVPQRRWVSSWSVEERP